jgi:hypothetical protein
MVSSAAIREKSRRCCWDSAMIFGWLSFGPGDRELPAPVGDLDDRLMGPGLTSYACCAR